MTKDKSNDELVSSEPISKSTEVNFEEKNIENAQSSQLNESSPSNQTNKASNEFDGFTGFGFSEGLINTLLKKGYKEPTPIQKAAIPELMLGRDLLGQARTQLYLS